MELIELNETTCLYVDEEYACFQGYTEDLNQLKESVTVAIPLKEITNNMEYWLESRAKFIIKKEKQLKEEKQKLKKRVKLIKE